MKKRILVYLICLLAIWGALEVLFFWEDAVRDTPYMIANSIFHLPLIAGFLWLAIKGKPEFRLHPFWTPLGLLMILWPLLTVILADLFDPDRTLEIIRFFQVSETLWYGLAFGLLLGFYSIRSIRTFWYFLLPLLFGWLPWLFSLLLQSFGLSATLKGGAPTLASYFHSGKFWNDWGWFLSDMIVDVTIAATSTGMIISNLLQKIKK